MIKRTIEISGEGTGLSLRHRQLFVMRDGEQVGQVPIEDIGVLIVDTPSAHYTHGALVELVENGAAVVLCGANHHPATILLPLGAHHLHAERLRAQVEATLPTKKRAWQQIVQGKIRHQAAACEDPDVRARLLLLADMVKPGDPSNDEAQAARLYWSVWLGPEEQFRREREGSAPNNLLNYGYMALRATVARALVGAGLHPAIPIRHTNKYNAFGLADDLMEPFRPLVDVRVRELHRNGEREVTRDTKRALLELLTHTCRCGDTQGPLLLAAERLAVSLHGVLAGERRNLLIPEIFP